jgi:cytochrome c biogenesis protein CcmG, thiol:disulfide interchange protein DsbE
MDNGENMKFLEKLMLLMFIILLLVPLTGCSLIPDLAGLKNIVTQTTTDSTDATIEETTTSVKDAAEASNETTTSISESTATGAEKADNSKAATYNNDFTLKDLNGKDVSLSDFAGNIVVLNFWATWCPPCKAEIPDFIEVYNTYKDKGVSFIGVSLDEDYNALVNFVSDYKINYAIVHDSSSEVSNYWGIEAIPTTYFLDEKGKVLDSVVGQMPKENLILTIENLLNKDRT